jgi:hypothetical protein
VHDSVAAFFGQKVAVSVAQKTAGAFARGEGPFSPCAHGHLVLADRSLMIGQAHVLGPKLGRNREFRAGIQCDADHLVSHALGMHVDPQAFAVPGASVEDGLPQIVAALGHAAFAVDAKGHSRNSRAFLENEGQGVAGIRRLGLRREAGDDMVRLRAVRPFVGVGPKSELELQTAKRRLVADKPQHLQIQIALRIRQVARPHIIARNSQKERVGEI